jgi:hypothetical protein
MSLSTVASQYLVGSGSLSGHSISSVSADRPAAPLIGAVRTPGKARAQPIGYALRTPGTDAGAGRSGTVARICQHHTARCACRASLADLFKRDLRFGLERDRLGNMRLLATGRVFGSLLRQIKPVGDWQVA